MTTDITELAQMKGQKVEGSYYLAECTDCGKMYPSNKLNGGEPLFSGDYGECYCPHCNADDADIADLGSGEQPAVMAWNYQQARIDALVEALEKAQQRNGELETYSKTALEFREAARDENRHLKLELEIAEKRIAELESRTVTVKLPPKIERDDSDGWFMYNGGRVGGGAAEWYNKALDDVSSVQSAAVTVKLPTELELRCGEVCSECAGKALQMVEDKLADAGIKWEAE